MISSLAVVSALLCAPQSLLAQASLAPGSPVQAPPVQALVRIDRASLELAGAASRLDVISTDASGALLALATEAEISELKGEGVDVTIEVKDLAAYYAARLRDPQRQASPSAASQGVGAAPSSSVGSGWLPAFGQGGMGGYYTLGQAVGVLDQLRQGYPDLISAKVSIGTSVQGRDIWMVKVSDNPDQDEDEPEVLIDALHHGREPMSLHASLYFMGWLLESYGSDPLATYLVDHREIYFVPAVNPDGYEHNRLLAPGGGGLWRKNRRPNGAGSFGVDLNRNYPFQWGVVGSASDPASIVYHGPSPGSEPEVQAMIQLVNSRQFRTALTVHTFSNGWLAPLSWTNTYASVWEELKEMGDAATESFGYPHAPVPILLSEAGGTSLDYYFVERDVYCWAPEIGSYLDGFWPAQDRIVPLALENLPGFAGTAMAAGAWLRPEELILGDEGNGDGVFESGELVEVRARVRNSGRGDSGAVGFQLEVGSLGDVVQGTGGGSAASLTSAESTVPLRFRIRPGTPDGTVIPVRVEATEAGRPMAWTGEVVVGERVVAAFDFEDPGGQGWAVGTPNDAAVGNWERGDPTGSVDQPESDTTPGAGNQCWVTGNPAFPNLNPFFLNVTLGRTTLVSPAVDLTGADRAVVEFQSWFVARSVDVPAEEGLRIDLSDDNGQTWVSARVVDPLGPRATRGWRTERLQIDEHVALTSTVRMRVIAADVGNGSFIEAAVDDVVFKAVGRPECPLPLSFCTVSPNGFSDGSRIIAAGSQSVSDDAFELAVGGTPPFAFGIFFAGDDRANTPLGNGRLCVGGTLFRVAVVQSNGAGFAVEAVDQTMLSTPILGGQTWNFQCWHRDTIGTGINTSDAVEVTFCP